MWRVERGLPTLQAIPESIILFRLLGRLIACWAEVKNPLQTMLMGLQYLTHKVPANHEGIALALQDLQDAVTRANAILRGLLELSADTKSGTKPEDLNACVERSLELIHY